MPRFAKTWDGGPILGTAYSRQFNIGDKMIRTRPVFRLAVSPLILSGCNMPLPGTVQEPTSVNLRVQVSVPTDYRTGPGDV